MSEFGTWYKKSDYEVDPKPAGKAVMNIGDPGRAIYREMDLEAEPGFSKREYVHFPSGWTILVLEGEDGDKTWSITTAAGEGVTPTKALLNECLKRLNFGHE